MKVPGLFKEYLESLRIQRQISQDLFQQTSLCGQKVDRSALRGTLAHSFTWSRAQNPRVVDITQECEGLKVCAVALANFVLRNIPSFFWQDAQMSDVFNDFGFTNTQITIIALAFTTSAYPAPTTPSRGVDHEYHNARYADAVFANCGLPAADLERRRGILRALLASPSWLLQLAPVTVEQVQDFVLRTRRGRRMCCFCRAEGSRAAILECARQHVA